MLPSDPLTRRAAYISRGRAAAPARDRANAERPPHPWGDRTVHILVLGAIAAAAAARGLGFAISLL